MEPTDAQKRSISVAERQVIPVIGMLKGLVDTVKMAEEHRVPYGWISRALEKQGCDQNQCNSLISVLVNSGNLIQRGDQLFAAQGLDLSVALLAIVDTVAMAGESGATESTICPIVTEACGCTIGQFHQIMSMLLRFGKLKQRDDRYFAAFAPPVRWFDFLRRLLVGLPLAKR